MDDGARVARQPWPPGDGAMPALIRAHPWAATPLGPVEAWPQSLRTALEMVLAIPGPATILWGPQYVQLYNDAYIAIARDRHPALLGRPVRQGWAEIHDAVIAPVLDRAEAGQATRLVEVSVSLQGADGRFEDRLFDADWSPIRDESGAVAGVLQTLIEATDRRRARIAMRESEARHRLLIESWAQAIWETDANGVVVADSPSWRAYTGQTLEQWLGYGWLDAIHPDDRAYAERQWREAIAVRGLVDAEFRMRRPDGSWHWTNVRAAPVLDAAGHIEKWAGMNIDIDARKAAEAAFHAEEARLRTLMEGIPQLVWRSRDDGDWSWSSPQWRRFTGQTQEESRGLGWLDAVHPDDRPLAIRAWSRAHADDGLDLEFRVRRASDGAFLWHHTRAVPVRDEAGTVLEWLGTTTDVQQLKELQDRQAVLVGELQHRTRNLIGVVRSMADKTARSSADFADFRARFRDRLESLARVQGLLSRLEDTDRVTFDDLIRSELAAMSGSLDHVVLDGPSGVRLRSSTVQALAMTLHELATNAVKYGALGQPDGHLGITWFVEPSGDDGTPWLHVDWQESGVSMPPTGSAPRGTGQGRELIERALPYQLRARTSYHLGPDGVHCTIAIPVSTTTGESGHA